MFSSGFPRFLASGEVVRYVYDTGNQGLVVSGSESAVVVDDLCPRNSRAAHKTGPLDRAVSRRFSEDFKGECYGNVWKTEVMGMAWYQDQSAEDKFTILVGYLVRSFPLASILSRQVGDRYHMFVIAPFDGSREKTLQVETTIFHDQRLRVEEFAVLLSMRNLRREFDRGDRYALEWFDGDPEASRKSPLFDGSLSKQTQMQALVMH